MGLDIGGWRISKVRGRRKSLLEARGNWIIKNWRSDAFRDIGDWRELKSRNNVIEVSRLMIIAYWRSEVLSGDT